MFYNLLTLSLALRHCWVQAAPTIVQPAAAAIRTQQPFTLDCSLKGGSMGGYTMQWYRQEGKAIDWVCNEHGSCDPLFDGRFTVQLQSANNRFTLQLTELQPTDSGTYYCAASVAQRRKPPAESYENFIMLPMCIQSKLR
ncbi:hypothetical protein scyTo_0012004 [Scyliorhinus torazame]|uniref:Ig-like domain-containing protein n=1 Tax=Scyliorhinus torazame TaxID=75743 RepID=A0A401NZZ5_SCYTO|nr:hypothetical protein [Scyliorhinus torazame]